VVVGPAVIGAKPLGGRRAVVLGDVEPGAFYAGVPARKINEIGLGEKVDGGRRTEDGGRRTDDGGRRTEDG
jgi:acetyltransferase-like isoleucine patch superfamily enzyme